jgi:hypothetical protein
MKLTLKNTLDDIASHDMKDGQIGIITHWGNINDYTGYIVQRYNNSLIRIGYSREDCWNDWFNGPSNTHKDICRVRILESGTELVLE